MNNISPHITYAEATHTGTGLPNIPDAVTLRRMQNVAQNVFEPVRNYFRVPINVNSFYRSPAVNKAVGGAVNSQHVLGEAIDMDSSGVSDRELFDYIRKNLQFDQVILEPTWVHVSLREHGNRGQVLVAKKVNGKMTYENFTG